MFFCPFCGTLLLLVSRSPCNQLSCSACHYAVPVNEAVRGGAPPVLTITHSFRHANREFTEEVPLTMAPVAASATAAAAAASSSAKGGAAVGGATSSTANEEEHSFDPNAGAEGGQITTVACQNEQAGCESQKAYYIQIQMRSADEPASTFFKCVKCGFQWRQD